MADDDPVPPRWPTPEWREPPRPIPMSWALGAVALSAGVILVSQRVRGTPDDRAIRFLLFAMGFTAVASAGFRLTHGARAGKAAAILAAGWLAVGSVWLAVSDPDGGDSDATAEAQRPTAADLAILADESRLDTLAGPCRGGDDRACDVLVRSAPEDSAQWRSAQTCGGRGTSICTDGLPATAEDGYVVSDAPGWIEVVWDCQNGDMIACDLIYWLASPTTELRRSGSTCGGRVPEQPGLCVSALGLTVES